RVRPGGSRSHPPPAGGTSTRPVDTPRSETPQSRGFDDLLWPPSASAVGVRARARLRPELVHGVEVEDVLPAVDEPAVPDLEDDAAVDIKALAGSRSAVVVDGDDAALVVCEHVPQLGTEASPRRAPRGALVEDLG